MKPSSLLLLVISVACITTAHAESLYINPNGGRLLKDSNLDTTVPTGNDEDHMESSSASPTFDTSMQRGQEDPEVTRQEDSSSSEDVLIPLLPTGRENPSLVPGRSSSSFQTPGESPTLTVTPSSSSRSAQTSSTVLFDTAVEGGGTLTVVSPSSVSSVSSVTFAPPAQDDPIVTLQAEYPSLTVVVPTDEGADFTVATPAYLFGFIPVTMPITVHVTREDMDIDTPWWAFSAWDYGGDMESIALIVMQQAAKDAQDDLMGIMQDMKDEQGGGQRSSTGKPMDSTSDMGEMEGLRLQMAMDRVSKFMSELSNMLKKTSETSQGIIQNMK